MPTFVVTRKMSPELAARVQAAVSGHAGTPRSGRLKSALRLLSFVFVVAAAIGVVHFQRQRTARLEAQRAELLRHLAEHARQLTRSDRDVPARVAAAVALHAAPSYAGDFVAHDLRDAARLNAALAQPTLYLRGPLEGLAQAGRLSELSASSNKDAFLLCLLAPPETRTEKALRVKASAAYAQGPSMQQATAHVERVAPLLQALPLLGADWQRRIQSAETSASLQVQGQLLDAAPLGAGIRAAKARQLLLVLDEAGTLKSSAELDGEREHQVRVVLTDLTSGQARLRYRHPVDPAWLSDTARAQYASGIDSCALAFDLRQSIANLPSDE
ncbi:MAG TPA: hypothetical protein VEQ59_06455 [Polyangiaceae bacterium]|nr:hypothetical protein [Polyangiaceae bacterium]